MTKEQRIRNAFRKVFDPNNRDAALVLVELAKFCWWDDPTYAPGDALTTAFREGQRSVFLKIRRDRALTDEDIDKMFHEEKEADRREA